MKKYQKDLGIAAIGTTVLLIAISYLPIWGVGIIAFGVLYFVAKNNNLSDKA